METTTQQSKVIISTKLNDSSKKRVHVLGSVGISNRQIFLSLYDKLKNVVNSFRQLQDDWDGYGSHKINSTIIDNCLSVLCMINGSEIDKISDIYPNPNGTVSIEFVNNSNKLVLELGLNSYSYFVRKQGESTLYFDESNKNILDDFNQFNLQIRGL